jgi:hypothetical protein
MENDEWYNEFKEQLIKDFLMGFTQTELEEWIIDNHKDEFLDEFESSFKDFVNQEREAYQIKKTDEEMKRCL